MEAGDRDKWGSMRSDGEGATAAQMRIADVEMGGGDSILY